MENTFWMNFEHILRGNFVHIFSLAHIIWLIIFFNIIINNDQRNWGMECWNEWKPWVLQLNTFFKDKLFRQNVKLVSDLLWQTGVTERHHLSSKSKRLTLKKWHNVFVILQNHKTRVPSIGLFSLRWLTGGEISLWTSYHLHLPHNTLLLHFLRLGWSSLAVSKPRLSPLIFSRLKAVLRCEQLYTQSKLSKQ